MNSSGTILWVGVLDLFKNGKMHRVLAFVSLCSLGGKITESVASCSCRYAVSTMIDSSSQYEEHILPFHLSDMLSQKMSKVTKP